MVQIVADDGETLTFDCGCKAGPRLLGDGRRAYALLPCLPDASCEVSRFIQEETAAQGKPVQLVARASLEHRLFGGT